MATKPSPNPEHNSKNRNRNNFKLIIGLTVIPTLMISFIAMQLFLRQKHTTQSTTINSIAAPTQTKPNPDTTPQQSLLSAFLNGRNRAIQTEAKYTIRAINRTQQAYFLEFNEFAYNISDLQLSLETESNNYSYKIEVINPTQSVRLTATAKKEGIKSYTGAVFAIKKQNKNFTLTITEICETNTPSKIPPIMPKLIGGNIQCPAGSSSLRYV
ncbi:MAG TPA: type IV pilin-like G/H family protein [Nostocaceae cyanobacterium]|nr:type IV pilin-like G/H family protein [Nostocaceae cyanobacterium]